MKDKRLRPGERERIRREYAAEIEDQAREEAARRGERFVILNKPRRIVVPDQSEPWAVFNRTQERASRRLRR